MLLNHVAELIGCELIRRGDETVDTGDWGWFNLCITGPFARAHLERLVRKKVDILHCVIMPHTNDPAPVFGFDVIALNGTLTGMFLDLTPMGGPPRWPVPLKIEGKTRPLPDWANFFSPQMISIVPTKADVWMGLTLLRVYLDMLRPDANGDCKTIGCRQQYYTEQQRANPKTSRMLASIIGDERADEFIRTVLWPDVITAGGNHGRSPT